MNTIKVLKTNCHYCDKEFKRNYPLIENKELRKKYVNDIENYVNHLMSEHKLKVDSSLNQELGINNEDLK